MIKIRSRRCFVLALGLTACAILASPVSAGVQLTISDGRVASQTYTIGDTMGGGVNGGNGASMSGTTITYDGFTITQYKFGSDTTPTNLIALGAITISNSANNSVTNLMITLSENNFSDAGRVPLTLTSQGSITSATNATLNFQSYAGSGLNDTSGFTTGSQNIGSSIATSSNVSKSGFTPASTTYSLTSVMNFTIQDSGNISFLGVQASTTASTPEPASVISALVGLPVIGLIARKRRRAKLASQVSA